MLFKILFVIYLKIVLVIIFLIIDVIQLWDLVVA